jgi:drug/metabolite transporter (DMT)-like permease
MLGLHRLKGVDTVAVMAHFSGVASFFVGSWLALRWGSAVPWRFEPATVVMLLGVGLTGTVGQFFLTKAYAAGVPTRVSVISLTQVPLAMVFDVAVSGRALTSLALLGTCLVLAPAAWLASPRGFTRSDGGFFPSLALRACVMIIPRPQHKPEAQAREPYRGRGTETIDTDGGLTDTL